jgi:hypothetical protein
MGPFDFHFVGPGQTIDSFIFTAPDHGPNFEMPLITGPSIHIGGRVDELRIDPAGGFGPVKQGSASDSTEGGSPWMDDFFEKLSGEAQTGIPGTTFGPPAIWFDSMADLIALSDGFRQTVVGCRCR